MNESETPPAPWRIAVRGLLVLAVLALLAGLVLRNSRRLPRLFDRGAEAALALRMEVSTPPTAESSAEGTERLAGREAEAARLAGVTPVRPSGPIAPLRVGREPQRAKSELVPRGAPAAPSRAMAPGEKVPPAESRPASPPAPVVDWEAREIEGPIPGAYAVIYLSRRFLGICVGPAYVRRYSGIAVPRDGSGPREKVGDGRSPIGTYYVCGKSRGQDGPEILVSYPGPADAERALAAGRIGPEVARAIAEAHDRRAAPPADTPLGAGVRILAASAAEARDAAFGLDPGSMEELYTALEAGAWVIIRP